jgi:hypothetical protein
MNFNYDYVVEPRFPLWAEPKIREIRDSVQNRLLSWYRETPINKTYSDLQHYDSDGVAIIPNINSEGFSYTLYTNSSAGPQT